MTFRYVRGDVKEKRVRVESAHGIEVGDLVYLATDSIRAVTDLGTYGSVTLMQQGVHDVFAGVALHRKLTTEDETTEFVIATAGVFEFINGAAAAIEMGAIIGVDGDGSNQPLNQTVIAAATASATEGIGYCAQRIAATDSVVEVEIVSSVYAGGVQSLIT